MPFFSRVFRGRDAAKNRKNADQSNAALPPPKPRWEEAWSRTEVSPEEVQELVHQCTQEMKSRALDMPFFLLPFRPGSEPLGSKSFIRNYFRTEYDNAWKNKPKELQAELMLMEPVVLCSILKWCWGRLPGGVVAWETYELFKTGETDTEFNRSAFKSFIPFSVESEARKKIIFDFFDLLAAIAARAKNNGLGGRKLSRLAGWWAFEHSDNGEGFNGGYESWKRAANATSHLFFAYLRSLSPDSLEGVSGISQLPRSLQALLAQTEYPPQEPHLLFKSTARVVMIVNSVSPTPFELLRRAKHFEFRDDDPTLRQFSEYDDPVQSLTDECKRVLNRISATNQSAVPANGAPVPDGAWSRFEDIGFSSLVDSLSTPGDLALSNDRGLRSGAASGTDDFGRPTTPSWADFLSTGFPEDRSTPTLLPPDKQLPPLAGPRGHSSQSHVRGPNGQEQLDPGELAAVHYFDLDEMFWWVWMTSLADEETPERKAVFGRCALIETAFHRHPWLVIEEQVKGASPGQDEGVYIAEKKSRFSFTKRPRLNRRKTTTKKKDQIDEPYNREKTSTPMSRVDPDKEDRIKAVAKQIAQDEKSARSAARRGRAEESATTKTNSVLTLQPVIMNEAAPAMKWTRDYDKGTIKSAYLGDPNAGKGRSRDDLLPSPTNGDLGMNGASTPKLERALSDRDLPSLPLNEPASGNESQPSKAPPSMSAAPSSPAPKAEKPLPIAAFDEKPKIEESMDHPAFRSQHPPEMTKSATLESQPDRQQKKGAFKKLFGRKKEDPHRMTANPADMESALHPHKLQKAPPKTQPAAIETPVDAQPPPADEDVDPERDVQHNTAALDALEGNPPRSEMHEPRRLEPHRPGPRRFEPPADASRVGPAEQAEANKEFSRFDQGPLEDMPAFSPEEEEETAAEPSPVPPQEHFNTRAARLLRPEPKQAQPAPQERPSPLQQPVEDVSDVSTEHPADEQPAQEQPAAEQPSAPAAMPTSDRWAQIRKNAAERAQRMNEDQSGRSRSQSGKTDDGETSGEETIESRVARIKARVAEHTGNMDQQGAGTGGRR